MINAAIENITFNDEELFNRVRAYAAGDGINRPAVTLEDADSIAAYGVRETVQDFSDAVSFDDLFGKAQTFLDNHKDVVTEVDITFFYDTDYGPGVEIYEGDAITHEGNIVNYYMYTDNRELRRGDTIRIVSQSLGLNFTGVVEELDWEPGSLSLSIGRKRYNLLDVVNGRRLAAERGEAALGLAKPISFRASEGSPGVLVSVNPYVSQRAVGVEIYGSQTQGFVADRDTLLYRGVATRIELVQLQPGVDYYFRARSFDDAGGFSEFTGEIRGYSGYVKTGTIGPGAVNEGRIANGAVSENKIDDNAVSERTIRTSAVTSTKIKTGSLIIDDEGFGGENANRIVVSPGGDDKVAMGYINGRPGVPSNVDYGFWGALGTGVFIPGAAEVITAGYEINTQTYSTSTNSVGDIVEWIEVDVGWNPEIPEGFNEYFTGFASENKVTNGEGYSMGIHVYISSSVFGSPESPIIIGGEPNYSTRVVHTVPKWEIKSFDSNGFFRVETSTQWIVFRFSTN